jgi:hypothetical protein
MQSNQPVGESSGIRSTDFADDAFLGCGINPSAFVLAIEVIGAVELWLVDNVYDFYDVIVWTGRYP